jgi:hypothetical protein
MSLIKKKKTLMRSKKKEEGAVSWRIIFSWSIDGRVERNWKACEHMGRLVVPALLLYLWWCCFRFGLLIWGAILAVGYFVQGNTILPVFRLHIGGCVKSWVRLIFLKNKKLMLRWY